MTPDLRVDYNTTFDVLLEYRFATRKPVAPAPAADKKMVVDRMIESQRTSFLDGFAVRVGVRNIFDDAPPFADNVAGYPVSLEDPRQRFVFFDIEKKF